MITVENWVPAAESKPLVQLADSAMRFTPRESESTPTGPVVKGPNGRGVQPSFVVVLILGSKNSGCRRSGTNGSHSQNGCCGKDDDP